MKVVNLMNFVRQIDEREENSTEKLYVFTHAQIKQANELEVDHTFLLQYDVLCDERFVSMLQKERTSRTELGLWYEIVEPLASACGIPYRSERGWKWDWHIIPGFSMGYTPDQREALIDEAMRKFKEVFGEYPQTVASWLIDTHTVNYLAARYDVQALAICRDQTNTDAYTLRGGYFNQAYYPSRSNVFTPAQSQDMQVFIPVFRLLSPCPLHNYDSGRYGTKEIRSRHACFTLEPIWFPGSDPKIVECFLDAYYGEESLGFAYAQIGQENSFFHGQEAVLKGIRMQVEQLKARGDVLFMKMGETGRAFKARYPQNTPATSVVSLRNWDAFDAQSVYYDCKNYTVNLFRFEDRIFLRSLFLFDECVKDRYIESICTTFDAVYENLPVIDTMHCPDEAKKACGLVIDVDAQPFGATRLDEGVLQCRFGEHLITFYENCIEIAAPRLILYKNSTVADMTVDTETNGILFGYRGVQYALLVEDANVSVDKDGNVVFSSRFDRVRLSPTVSFCKEGAD